VPDLIGVLIGHVAAPIVVEGDPSQRPARGVDAIVGVLGGPRPRRRRLTLELRVVRFFRFVRLLIEIVTSEERLQLRGLRFVRFVRLLIEIVTSGERLQLRGDGDRAAPVSKVDVEKSAAILSAHAENRAVSARREPVRVHKVRLRRQVGGCDAPEKRTRAQIRKGRALAKYGKCGPVEGRAFARVGEDQELFM
jgi:hypothetical protein